VSNQTLTTIIILMAAGYLTIAIWP